MVTFSFNPPLHQSTSPVTSNRQQKCGLSERARAADQRVDQLSSTMTPPRKPRRDHAQLWPKLSNRLLICSTWLHLPDTYGKSLTELSYLPFTLALARLEAHPQKPSTLAAGDSPPRLLALAQMLASPAGSVPLENNILEDGRIATPP